MRRAPGVSVFAGLLTLGGCAGRYQSAVDTGGPEAGGIATLWWIFLAVLSLVFLVVIALLLLSLMRRHRDGGRELLETAHAPSGATEYRLTRIVAAATILTVLILFALLIGSVSAGKALANPPNRQNALTAEVTGHQWWWQVRYMDRNPQKIVMTANELHIPVGRPVRIRGTSQDVIHSFWVPGLNGKRDLIPSRVTEEWIEAERPGRFRGQCAEFCGLQHAHMAVWVVAEPEDQFEAWLKHQQQPAAAPADAVQQRGYHVFMNSACVLCHNITGTPANGQVAPDLTHFASRLTIAAGTLANNTGNLGGWILDPQTIKAGNHMATVHLDPADVQPLLKYLESLQ